MAETHATGLLRAGLLDGVRILVAGAPAPPSAPDGVDSAAPTGESPAMAVRGACAALGARVCSRVLAGGDAQEESAGDAATQALDQMGDIDLLFVDGASLFAAASVEREARDALVACLEAAWIVTRAVAERAFIASESGGRIVYLAPARSAGVHAGAAAAGLENLARTLSIEWARYGITPVAIAPGVDTASGEVAALTAYLASPAGDYFSGCVLDLRGPEARP
jgi:citronellol/citronellal dehydrogenase